MNLITVQCPRASSTHVQIGAADGFAFVAFINCNGTHEVVSSETVLFADHPEIADLHDGDGWNLDTLNALVANMGCGDES